VSARRFLIVRCHPVPDSFLLTAVDRAEASLRGRGHDCRVIDLYAEGFDPVLGRDEWQQRQQGVPESLRAHTESLSWATDLVLAYPTWYGSTPAMLKGWFDRVWGKGVAWDLPPGARRPTPLLRNIRKVWVITTHGSPKAMNILQGEAGRQFMLRTLRLTCSLRCRVRWLAFYGNDGATAVDRVDYLDRIGRRFAAM
jgi:NAD(P)H dehydrogenase (quinone)